VIEPVIERIGRFMAIDSPRLETRKTVTPWLRVNPSYHFRR
jgi:hypothetical protein